MRTLQLKSGFIFDYTNLYCEGGVEEKDIKEIADKVKAAQKAAQEVRKTGIVKGHFSKDGEPELVLFPQLPYIEEGHINSPQVMRNLKALQAHAQESIDVVVSFGIGGSYLGNKVIFDLHCGEFWNTLTEEERNNYPKVLFSGNNVDPRRTKDVIDFIKKEANRKGRDFKALFFVISKSGSTIEPMSNFMVVQKAMEEAEIAYEVVAVTDPHEGEKETLLHRLAKEENWPIFSVPDGVGGRFSVFTEVGLVLAAVVGFDIDSFLEGAKAMDQACATEDLWNNPALLNATLKYIAAEKYGRHIEVFMPYGDYLKSTAEWYVQLLSESLGKTAIKENSVRYYGRTPVVAVGTTDMHAQTQEHQEGRKDKVVQFLQVAEWDDLVVPPTYDRYPVLEAFSQIGMSKILRAALESNAAALTGDGRLNATFTLPKVSPFHIGELLFLLCWSIFYEGQLAEVDAFNQPGVEVYKKLLGPKLGQLK